MVEVKIRIAKIRNINCLILDKIFHCPLTELWCLMSAYLGMAHGFLRRTTARRSMLTYRYIYLFKRLASRFAGEMSKEQ